MTSAKKPKLMIIDGNALIHRSFHALPPTIATKDGTITNAVYGFTTVLLRAIRDFKPDYVVLTLDRKAKTFRHEAYTEYKAQRVKAPDELYAQIPLVKQVAQAFKIPVFEKDGFEADDLIGTIATQVDKKIEKIIVTGDMDTLQLITDQTKVYTMSRGLSDSVIYDAAAVQARFGLDPNQMIDYKALRGDPSDNIPGVRGIGEKTAVELLKEFKTLKHLYDHLERHPDTDKIKPRIKGLLIEYKADALMSQSLATIKCDVDINLDVAQMKLGNFDKAEVLELFTQLEFKSLIPRLDQVFAINGESEAKIDKFSRDQQEFKYTLIDNDRDFEQFLVKLKKQAAFTFDTETTSLDPFAAEILGISFAWQAGTAYYLNLQTKAGTAAGTNLFNYQEQDNRKKNVREAWLKNLKPILIDEKVKKYGHNMKYDLRIMRQYGIEVNGLEFDTMIASYLLNPGTRQHNLDAVVFAEFGFDKINTSDLLGEGKNKVEFGAVPVEKMATYSCEDADFTFRLVTNLDQEIKAGHFEKLFQDLEMPLVKVLADMEDNGIKIDVPFLATLGQKLTLEINQIKKEIKAYAGIDFNINSTQQLREVLFEKLKISTDNISKTKTGLSTSADELAKLQDAHPIIPLIQKHRELSKLLSTYIEALPELVTPATGRLHTSFNQVVTSTGRLSSSEPNLQNIPIRTELGREIRKAFIAEPGFELLSLDYSQIELRLAAHLAGDQKMIKAFQDGADIHSLTAAEINDVSLEKVTSTMRREAKAINFGILYGQGPYGLSQAADIPFAQARKFIDDYFLAFPGVREFLDTKIALAHEHGYAETLFGRRRYLPEINSTMPMVKKEAERMAINAPIQGTAADMIKAAMIEVNQLIKKINQEYKKEVIKLLLQVHDELVFEVQKDLTVELAPKIAKIMEQVMKLDVPIVAEAKSGKNWGEMRKIKN